MEATSRKSGYFWIIRKKSILLTLIFILMRRFVTQKKSVVLGAVFTGLFLSVTLFSFGVSEAPQWGPSTDKKEKQVKVIVTVNGNESKIDTAFNISDDKRIDEKVDSLLHKYKIDGGTHKNLDKFFLIRDKSKQDLNMLEPVDDNFDILIQNSDSGSKCEKPKVVRISRSPNYKVMDDNEMMPPPMPGHPPVMIKQRLEVDPFAFDTKDESVVSYEKKDIGNGLERITIVRKKHEDPHEKKEIRVRAEIRDDSKK